MALRFYDSFSHYTQPFMGRKWDVVEHGGNGAANTCGMTQAITGGRSDRGGMFFTDADDGNTVRLQYAQRNYSAVSTVIVTLAFKQTGTQNNWHSIVSGGGRLLSFLDGSTCQVALTVLQSGQLCAIRNTSAGGGLHFMDNAHGTVLGTSTDAISSSSFDSLEVKIVHHPTTGSITVKANNELFWTLSNVNTAISGTSQSASVVAGGYHQLVSGNIIKYGLKGIISDFNIIDTVAGSDARDPVDFAGDLIGERLTPTADGNYTEWTPNSGAVHFDRIAEIPPDGDTTYNASGTLNQRDSFIVSDSTAPTSTVVKAIVLTMYCRKDNGGSNRVSGLMRLAGADGLGGDFDVPADYAFRQSFIFSTPAGAAITVADVNSAELGYRKTT